MIRRRRGDKRRAGVCEISPQRLTLNRALGECINGRDSDYLHVEGKGVREAILMRTMVSTVFRHPEEQTNFRAA